MNIKNKGFTLVELMVTVAIIGTLAAIAYPSYTAHSSSSKRADAIVALNIISLRLEEYSLNNDGYNGATVSGLYGSTTSERDYYDLTLTAADGSGTPDEFSYLITATPKAPHVDADCGFLTLNSLGTKGSESGVPGDCWKK